MSTFSDAASPASPAPAWKSTTDARTGRVYYYNSVTRATSWTKPAELTTKAERDSEAAHEQFQRDFFSSMEANIRERVQNGMTCAEVEVPRVLPTLARRRSMSTDSQTQMIRSISTIDDSFLTEERRRTGSIGGRGRLRSGSFEAENQNGRRTRLSTLLSLDLAAGTSPTTAADAGYAFPVKPQLAHRNSTGTLFLDSTMGSPDKEALIRCVCAVVRAHLREAERNNTCVHDAFRTFDDVNGPGPGTACPHLVPSMDQLQDFMRHIFYKGKLEVDTIVLTLIYIEKLVKVTKGRLVLRHFNWKSILFASMVMASKVWDDLSMWNADFSHICGSFTLARVNQLELAMLDALSFNVTVAASEYAKYFFHLRSMGARLGLSGQAGLDSPLSLTSARKLSMLTEQYQVQMKTAPALKRRCVSLPFEGEAESIGLELEAVSLEQVVSMETVQAGERTPTTFKMSQN